MENWYNAARKKEAFSLGAVNTLNAITSLKNYLILQTPSMKAKPFQTKENKIGMKHQYLYFGNSESIFLVMELPCKNFFFQQVFTSPLSSPCEGGESGAVNLVAALLRYGILASW